MSTIKNAAAVLVSRDLDEVFRELGFADMSPEEKAEMTPRLLDHLSNIAFAAAIDALAPADRVRMAEALDGADAERKIAEIAAGVPGLQDRINEAIQEEILTLRVAKEAL